MSAEVEFIAAGFWLLGRIPPSTGTGMGMPIEQLSSRSSREMTRRAARFSSPCSSRTAGSSSGASGAAASFFEGQR